MTTSTPATPIRRALSIVARAVPVAVAAVASIAYGLTFGFTYGVNNQVGYMLGALHLLDPSIFNQDWYVAHTLNYHPVFGYLGWLLLVLGGRGGWGVGIATVVFAAAGAMGVYWLATRLLPRQLSLTVFLLVLIAMYTTGTREMAGSYAFDPIFQPSMVASACLVASLAPFVAGRWLTSGIIFAVGGAFHVNFLILGLAVFGIAHLAIGREGFRDRVLRQLGPAVLVLLLLSPVILKGIGGGDAVRAQQILFEIRSPHHYRPRGYIGDFFTFACWQMVGLGLGAWVFRIAEGKGRRMGGLVLGLLAVVWLGSFFAIVFDSKRAIQLFVWRFAPYIDILMELLVAATAARLLLTPRAPLRMSRASQAAALAGGAALAISLTTKDPPTVTWLERIAEMTFVGLALKDAIPRLPRLFAHVPAILPRVVCWVAPVAAAFVFHGVVKGPLDAVRSHSNLMTGMPGPETDLYAWLREHTDKDAIILSPPGLERFRLASERAIVVDWKVSTYAPSELVQWYERLEDVSGRRGFHSRDEIVQGYDTMDQARLDSLRDKYHLSYAVVGRGRDAALGHHVVYSNGGYAVLDLR